MSARSQPRRAFVALAIIAGGIVAVGGRAVGQTLDCGLARILCVDASGVRAEFPSIQAAVDRVRPGDRVVVHPGRYPGFRVRVSGRPGARVTIEGLPGAVVDRPEDSSSTGIYLQNVSYVTITGFEVRGQGGLVLGIAARDASARRPVKGLELFDNVVSGTRSTAIYLSQVSRSLIQGNTAVGSKESHGIYLSNAGSDSTELVGNEVFNNAVNGIHFNGDASVGGDGVQTKLGIRGNRVYHNGANGLNMDGVRDTLIVNNAIYDNGRHGLRGYAIDAAAGPARLRIVNNTFADNGGWALKLSQDDGGHIVFNNILLSDAGSLAVGAPRLRTGFNLVGSRFSVDSGDTELGPTEWRRLGFGKRSVRGSDHDIFAGRRAHDYSLTSASVATRSGARRFAGVRAPRQDIRGLKRKGRRDIGAHSRH